MFTSRHGSATRDEFWRVTAMMVIGVSMLMAAFVYLVS